MRHIALLVGNGINIDYRAQCKTVDLSGFDTQNPLRWRFPIPREYSTRFSWVSAALEFFNDREPTLNDFEVIEQIIQRPWPQELQDNIQEKVHDTSSPEMMIAYAMAEYMVVAFSHYYRTLLHQHDSRWSWFRWFKRHGKKIRFIASFNYDLLLEDVLDDVGLKCRYVYREEPYNNFAGTIPMFKPHGSINYRFRPEAISLGGGQSYLVRNNDMPIKIVQEVEALGGGNVLPDIVLPGEASIIRSYQYVRPGFEMFRRIGAELDYLIVIGLSYWDCDRMEIDELLKCVSREARIIIVHPEPSKVNRALIEKCRGIAKCQVCKEAPMLLL